MLITWDVVCYAQLSVRLYGYGIVKKLMRKKLFSVTIKDCKVETFTVGGHGGAGKDTSNTGVRIVHPPSGAVGKSTESRSQGKNKETAFRRMAETREFQTWARIKAAGFASVDAIVLEQMHPSNLKVEYRTETGWSVVPAGSCEHCGPILTGRVREKDGTSWCDSCWEAEGW